MSCLINTPWTFSAVWSVIKGWIEERVRAKLVIMSGDPLPELLKHVDIDQLPTFLGGNNTRELGENHGPWEDYEVVDGSRKNDIVGIRRITDGPNGKIFTP